MPQRDRVECEVYCWAVRKVGDDESVGNSAMFMEDDEVGNIIGPTGFCKFFHDVVATVESMRVWEYEPHFLKRMRTPPTKIILYGTLEN